MNLLAKTRKINAMLQKAAGKAVNFKEMAESLSEVIEANVFVVSRRGKLLGIAVSQQIENERMYKMLEDKQFPEEYTKTCSIFLKPLRILISKANILLSQSKTKSFSQLD